ncbi:MAG: DUF1641 domain-containing protein [Ardenticatenaceae bacterium]|nr:DUF1641 domain-containing protein [Ardenticatenaceae bacterium]
MTPENGSANRRKSHPACQFGPAWRNVRGAAGSRIRDAQPRRGTHARQHGPIHGRRQKRSAPQVGLFALLRSLNDPDIQNALGFLLNFGKRFGRSL